MRWTTSTCSPRTPRRTASPGTRRGIGWMGRTPLASMHGCPTTPTRPRMRRQSRSPSSTASARRP
ncbi:MAG: hypothetical protein E6I16_15545 [Chloroflexi bacterium]|nr:MAG: hypothetical protein E6I16_15545 [Chloroflexota bacterium]